MTQYTFKLESGDGTIIEQPRAACSTMSEKQTKKSPIFENVTMSGITKIQKLSWEKIVIDVSGSGRTKPYFHNLNYTSAYKYYSFNPLILHFNGANVPAGTYTCKFKVRQDQAEYTPFITGLNADGKTIRATIDSIEEKTIAFTFAEPVTECNIGYFPIYNVRILPFSEPSYDNRTGTVDWSISMETL